MEKTDNISEISSFQSKSVLNEEPSDDLSKTEEKKTSEIKEGFNSVTKV